MNFLDYSGLQRFLDRLKAIIPTKTSDITNDSGYLDTTGVQNYMENGGGYSQSYIDTALSGKSDTGHTHTKSEITDFPSLATVATSGDYTDLSNKPSINDATLTIQKNSTNVATFTANASSNVTANITVPTAVSELTNDSGYLTSASSLDSSKLTGTIDIARLPKGALERLVTVANQTARYALTVNDVQLGDTVKQLDTGVMYIVVDESKLSSADGYTEYTAGSATSVPWSGITGKPSDFTPSSHTHGSITNDGKLGTASRALITDSSKNITVSSVSDTELGYLSGVTSSVQTQLNGKAASSHTHQTSDVTDLLSGNHTWTGDNTFSKTIVSQDNTVLSVSNSSIEIGEIPANEQQKVFIFRDKNNDTLSYFRHLYQKTGASQLDFIVRNKFTSGSPSTSGTIDYTSFSLSLGSDGSKTGTLQATLKPSATNTYDLGTSSYKWRKVYSDDVVHTSGDESVSGTKSFNSDLNLNYANTDVDDIVNSVAGSSVLDNFVHMTGNETVSGIKSFPDGVIANVTGSATSATNDGSGNVISGTYGKLGAVNEWGQTQIYKGMLLLSNTSDVVEQFQQKLPKDVSTSTDALVRFNTLVDSEGHNVVTNSEGHWETYVAKSTTLKYKNDSTKTGTISFRLNSNGQGILYPLSPFECSLGNAQNQWSEIYGKSCYCKSSMPILQVTDTVLEKGVQPATNRTSYSGLWKDKNGSVMGYSRFVEYDNGTQTYEMHVRNNVTNGALDPSGTEISGGLQLALFPGYSMSSVVIHTSNMFPGTTNATDLGTSSNQWRKIYGRDYYYNGTQWGLDKANTWSVAQTIRGQYPDLVCQNTGLTMGSNANVGGCVVRCQDTAGNDLAFVSMRVNGAGRTIVELGVRNTYKNGILSNDQDAEVVPSSFIFGQLWNSVPYYQLSGNSLNDINPMNLNGTNQNLGTSSYKWKTLNGLNPGSLSLPDQNSSDVDLIDTGADSGWDLTGTSINTYTADFDGWLCLSCADVAGDFLFASYGNPAVRTSISGTGQITNANVGRGLCLYLPVASGNTVSCLTKASSNFTATFIPCKGNV